MYVYAYYYVYEYIHKHVYIYILNLTIINVFLFFKCTACLLMAYYIVINALRLYTDRYESARLTVA